MRRAFAFALLLAALSPLALDAQDDAAERFSRANELYDQREFQQAAELYESLLADGLDSHVLHFNLGNALYRAGRIGMARLHYERALRLRPTFDDAAYNISFIERRYIKQTLREENFSTIDQVLRRLVAFYPPGWSLPVAAAAFLLLNLVIALKILRSRALPHGLGWTLIVVFSLILVVSAAFAAAGEYLAADRSYAVVVVPDTGVGSEPAEDAVSRFPAPEAAKVLVLARQGDWLEIMLPNGSKGWVRAGAVEII